MQKISSSMLLLILGLTANLSFNAVALSEQNLPTKQVELRYDISGSSAWYPYFIPDGKHPGIVAELIPKILERAGIVGNPISLPPKRTLLALSNGELDFDVVSPSWFPEQRISPEFVLSDGMLEIKEYIVTLPENRHLFSSVEQSYGKQIGTIRGYLYNNDHLFSRMDFNSEFQLVQALRKGRIEAAILGDLPAIYWAEHLQVEVALATLHSQGDLHIRLRKEHQYLLDDINRAIASLSDSGELTAIVSHYIGPQASTLAQKTSE